VKYRVAITGLGIVSALGCEIESVTAALRSGASGVVADSERSAFGFISPLTRRIPDYTPQYPLSRKERTSKATPQRSLMRRMPEIR